MIYLCIYLKTMCSTYIAVYLIHAVSEWMPICCFRHGGGVFSLPNNLVISVRQLQHAIDCACLLTDNCSSVSSLSSTNTPFYIHQKHFIDCITDIISIRWRILTKTVLIYILHACHVHSNKLIYTCIPCLMHDTTQYQYMHAD